MNIYSNLFFCINKYLTFRPIFNLMVIWHFEIQFFFQKICFHLLKLCFIKWSNEREINLRYISKTFYTGMGRGGGLDKIVEYFVFFHCTLQMQFLNDVFQNNYFFGIFIIQLHWYSWRYRQDFHACGKCELVLWQYAIELGPCLVVHTLVQCGQPPMILSYFLWR